MKLFSSFLFTSYFNMVRVHWLDLPLVHWLDLPLVHWLELPLVHWTDYYETFQIQSQ